MAPRRHSPNAARNLSYHDQWGLSSLLGHSVICVEVTEISCDLVPWTDLVGTRFGLYRLNAVKIFRCFPHCCPHHVMRSYCGSPLHVKGTGVDAGEDASQLQVYAHFCDSSTPGPQVGDSLSLSTLHGSLQSGENTNGEWISSELVGHSGSRTSLFEINPSRRWYYSCRSTRRNEDRMRTHVLEALVVVADETTGNALVLAVVKSPPFKITSFRRSNPVASANQVRPLKTLEASLLAMAMASPIQGPSQRPGALESSVARPLPSRENSVDDSLTFQVALAWLLASLPENGLPQTRQLVPIREDYLSATSVIPGAVSTTKEAIVSFIAWWLVTDPSIQEAYDNHAAEASGAFEDLEVLGSIFADWMRWLRAQIDTFLQSRGTSWRAIVTASALEREKTHQRWLPLHGFDWENFVARARQHTIAKTREHHVARDSRTSSAIWWTTTRSTLAVARVHADSATGPLMSTQGLAVDTAIAFTLQLSSIIDASFAVLTLEIRSVLHGHQMRNQRREATRLVLDGRYRSFNSLPHGESALCAGSLLGGQRFGDYVGIVNAELQRVEVACFSWPTELWRRTEPANGGGAVDGLACRWSWKSRNEATHPTRCFPPKANKKIEILYTFTGCY